MTGNHHPAEPVVDDKKRAHGGFAGIAKLLNKRYPDRRRPISRQLVYKWWTNRHYNRFPETSAMQGSANGGRGNPVFNYREVVEWYTTYQRHHGGPLHQKNDTTAQTQHTGEDDALAA
jgi:hypothetical protein